MTAIGEMPITRVIDHKRSVLVEPFFFHSDVLKADCIIPPGFEMDWESVPLIKGTSKIAGLIHDYLCRKDSNPVVTKKIAADVYREFLIFRGASWWRWRAKYWTVRIAPGYFHKLKVLG
jgi:hypothetical protein